MLRRELQKDKDKVTEILKTFGESTIEITGWIDLVLGYKGTDFPGFNVFHTRHSPTSPKYKLVSPVTDAED